MARVSARVKMQEHGLSSLCTDTQVDGTIQCTKPDKVCPLDSLQHFCAASTPSLFSLLPFCASMGHGCSESGWRTTEANLHVHVASTLSGICGECHGTITQSIMPLLWSSPGFHLAQHQLSTSSAPAWRQHDTRRGWPGCHAILCAVGWC